MAEREYEMKNFFYKLMTFEGKKRTVVFYVALAFVLNLVIEMLGRKSIVLGVKHLISSPFVFFCNMSIILATLTISLFFSRRFFALCAMSIVWVILGCVNFYLLSSRVTPFTRMDFLNIDSALNVINKYFNVFSYILLGIVVVLVITGMIILFIKGPKVKNQCRFLTRLAMVGLTVGYMFMMLFVGNVYGALSMEFPELSQSYLKYGFAYCFTNSLVNSGVSKPSTYSKEKIESIKTKDHDENQQDRYDPYMDPSQEVKTPNIIIVQLESFFDITRCNDMDFSEDPLPNYHKYQNECASGLLSMPVVGAGTVNSEFEVVTGLNIDNFGPGEYPFKTTLRNQNCESMAYNLSNHGYTSHVVHNNTASFYGRNVVYDQLGFNDFTAVEYLNLDAKTDYTPMGWAKDYCLTQVVNDALDSTEDQDFVYTISVQGHGSYPTEDHVDYPIQLSAKSGYDISNDLINAREYYTNQIHEMDEFVGQLIDSVNKRGEDSIVVFYGDHLPSLSFEESEFNGETIYQTEYFIWTNMEDVTYEDKNIQAYQLEATILKQLGIRDGFVNAYHQDNMDSLAEETYLDGLANLQYDIFGGDLLIYNGTNPYTPFGMKMGLYDIEITSIYKQTEENAPENETEESETVQSDKDNITQAQDETPDIHGEGYVIIKGKNFTKYSKVFVNGEYFSGTEFIDENTLRIYYPQLQGLDSFVVSQAHSDSNVLSSTNEVLYYGEEDSFEEEVTTEEEGQVSKENS